MEWCVFPLITLGSEEVLASPPPQLQSEAVGPTQEGRRPRHV